MLVGLYILMGMGLNLEVGPRRPARSRLRRLLRRRRLYHGASHRRQLACAGRTCSYWEAMPIAVLRLGRASACCSALPVLGVRGDYLAVATMGLGEIVRVIVQSDFAAPLLGGAQGILQIPKPRIGSFELERPGRAVLPDAGLRRRSPPSSPGGWKTRASAAPGWRCATTRTWRRRSASTSCKVEAAGLRARRRFRRAGRLDLRHHADLGLSVSSFQLLISINVLALIIVGGMGSLPGVVVGSMALVGPAGAAARIRRVPLPVLRRGARS